MAIKKFRLKNAEDFDFADSWANGYIKREKTHRLVQKIKNRYRVGLITNHYIRMLDLSFEKGIVPNIKYDSIVASYELGYRKPESEIYKIAEKRAGVNPENIFYIDDTPAFIEAAKKRGWQTKWFDTENVEKTISEIENILLS